MKQPNKEIGSELPCNPSFPTEQFEQEKNNECLVTEVYALFYAKAQINKDTCVGQRQTQQKIVHEDKKLSWSAIAAHVHYH